MKTIHQLLSILVLGSITLSSCTKWLEITDSKNQVEQTVVFKTNEMATSALLGAYATLATVHSQMKHISLYSDEFGYTSITENIIQFRDSKVLPDAIDNSTLWTDLYSVIYQVNAVIEGVSNSETITLHQKKLLAAEAKFLRAYSYFYLLNLYGSVPLVLSTDVGVNRVTVQRSPLVIYDQMIKDLQEAKSALPESYAGTGKVRANHWAASALLSRVYLYQEKWSDAESESAGIIASGLYSPLNALEDVFSAGSTEGIFQLWTVNGFLSDAALWIPPSNSSLPVYPLTDALYDSFDNTDGRKTKWVTVNEVIISGVKESYPYFSKYKNKSANPTSPEYIMSLRLAEQYLICAEAQTHLGKLSEAVANLNVIRSRATGLTPLATTINQKDCLKAVMKERRNELFGEWGHRFFDLKRTSQIDEVMQPIKPSWRSTAQLLPIPKSEITFNPKLIQNEGY